MITQEQANRSVEILSVAVEDTYRRLKVDLATRHPINLAYLLKMATQAEAIAKLARLYAEVHHLLRDVS